MTSQQSEELNHCRKLLAIQKRNEQHYEQQAALQGGEVYAPISVRNGLQLAREEITRLTKRIAELEGGVVQPDAGAPSATSASTPTTSAATISSEQIIELAKLMLDCPHISDLTSRNTLISLLPPTIRNGVVRHSSNLIDVINLIQASYHYPEGLRALLNTLREFDSGTAAMQQVEHFWNNLNR